MRHPWTLWVLIAIGVLVVASGCAGVTSGAIDVKDAKTQIGVFDQARSDLAKQQLQMVSQPATIYMTEHGSLVGFAAQFTASEPQLAATLKSLTDTQASVVITAGSCWVMVLPAQPPTQQAC